MEDLAGNEFPWRSLAACLEHDPELFFPSGETGTAARQIERAKAVCHTCPVQIDCLAYAVETGQRFGVWGGTDEAERRVIRRRWVAAAGAGVDWDEHDLIEALGAQVPAA